MDPRYDMEWLLQKLNAGDKCSYLFFWGHINKHGEDIGKFIFSQWYEACFTVDGTTYRTAEHWMMAQKALLFGDIKTFQRIVDAEKPGHAKELGRQIVFFKEEVWNANRFHIVKTGNVHKFNQHPKLAAYLSTTGDKILVEASPVDTIWGIGLRQDAQNVENPHFWNGLNLLGFALMEVRDLLRRVGHFTEFQASVELPWKLYPNVGPDDMFWRMGEGENAIIRFSKYFSTLSERDKEILKLTRPAPYEWKDFYQR